MRTEKTWITEINGTKQLHVLLAGKEFILPFKMIGGNLTAFLDLSGQVDLVEHAAEELVQRLKEADIEYDVILCPVAKSIALTHALATRHEPVMERTVVARKARPNEHHRVEAEYVSITTNGVQTLYLSDEDAEYVRGKRVLLVDDVYGAGGTTAGLKSLLEQAGAVYAGEAVVAREDHPGQPADLISLFVLPVFVS